MEEAKMFEKAGVGFGEETTYIIFKSLERFCITKQAKEIKFWGTILGTTKDYYIIETST
jgi:radial spoke head protein 4/6